MQLTEQQRAELERHGIPVRGAILQIDGTNIDVGVPYSIEYLRKAAVAAHILGITPHGYRLVPHGMVEALIILAEGCPTHPGYRAKRPATATYCERCKQVWEARQTLTRLRQNGGEER